MKLRGKITGRFAWLTAFIVLAIVTAIGFLTAAQLRPERFDCSGWLKVESGAFDFTADLNSYLLMEGDKRGYFNVSGKVFHARAVYTVERSWRFNYEDKKRGVYHLSDISVSRRQADNTPDTLMDKVFISPEADHGRYIKINALGNAMVIEGVYSPLLVCVMR